MAMCDKMFLVTRKTIKDNHKKVVKFSENFWEIL
jgi:hypothetical protein